MRRCVRCILPESFPGIDFDQEQICQFCRGMPSPEDRIRQRSRLASRFEDLVDAVRQLPGYHCIVAWGGGAASSYTLYLLRRRYNLRVLAYTLDNGFLSPTVFQNTRRMAEHLDIDHLIVKPRFELMKRLFVASSETDLHPPRALERGSSICNSCTAVIRGVGLRLALEHRAPMLVQGWLPGQIPLASAFFASSRPMLQAMVGSTARRLIAAGGEELGSYFPEESQVAAAQRLPVTVAPLVLLPYEAEEAERDVRSIGWEGEGDVHFGAATCLLHLYANQVHLMQKGFHPCVMELATMVREGALDRDVALQQLREAPASPVMRAVAVKLGLYPGAMGGRIPEAVSV